MGRRTDPCDEDKAGGCARALTEQLRDLSDKHQRESTNKSDYESLLAELKEAYKKANSKNDWPVAVRNHEFEGSGELKRAIVECNQSLENAAKLVESYSTAKNKIANRLDEIDKQRTKLETIRKKLDTDLESAKVQHAQKTDGQ